MLDIYCQGLTRPLRLENNEEELWPELRSFLGSWPHRLEPGGAEPVDIAVSRTSAGRYLLQSPEFTRTLEIETLAELFCDLAADLAGAWLSRQSAWLGLHAAAVELGGRLLLFPQVRRGGKSLLAACLMALGGRVYADDLLAVSPDGLWGRAFGLPLRLRRPLPPLKPEIEAYLKSQNRWSDARYLFVGQERLASFGQRLPLGALLVIRRRRARPSLSPLAFGQALKVLLNRAWLQPGAGADLLAWGQAILRRCPAWLLTYESADEAAELLRQRFGSPQASSFEPLPAEAGRPALGTDIFGRRLRSRGALPKGAFRRRPGLALTETGAEAFLVSPEGDEIFHFNASGALVWQLLAEPLTLAQGLELLAAAFPHTPMEKIEKDLRALLFRLLQRGLIEAIPA